MKPRSHEELPKTKPRRRSGCLYAFWGAVIGGCVIPLVHFFFGVIVLRDTGGPLFWPLISILLGLIWARSRGRILGLC